MSRGVAPGVIRRYYKRGEDNAWAYGWSVKTLEGFFSFEWQSYWSRVDVVGMLWSE